MERFEAEHPPRDALDEAVILLKDIVQIFDLRDLYGLPSPSVMPSTNLTFAQFVGMQRRYLLSDKQVAAFLIQDSHER